MLKIKKLPKCSAGAPLRIFFTGKRDAISTICLQRSDSDS